MISRYLGPNASSPRLPNEPQRPGVATGLAWTPVGEISLFIEASKMKGKGNLILTVNWVKFVKRNLLRAALSYLRSNCEK